MTRLTNNNANDGFPDWSPDGQQIAFESDRDGNWEIYVMGADGSGVTRLTNNDAIDGFPDWSPDGQQIAFESDRDGDWEIYVMGADGSGVTRLTNNDVIDGFPDWSPDGQQIVFHSDRDGDWEIYVMGADGSGVTRLTNNNGGDGGPVWSPDGQQIAFESDRDGDWEIYVMGADGSGVTRLTNNNGGDGGPVWSPDGQQIAFESDRDGDWEIYVMGADGSGVTRLTNNNGGDGGPAWSPDGQQIAFASDRDGGSEIYVMDAAAEAVALEAELAAVATEANAEAAKELLEAANDGTYRIDEFPSVRMISAGGTGIVLQSVETFSDTAETGAGFRWSQLFGPSVELLNADTEHAQFLTPTVVEDTDLVFMLENGGTVIDIVRVRLVPKITERVLAALVDFLDVDPEERPLSKEDVVNLLESNDDSLGAFISHTSRNLMDVDFDVLDWVTVNKHRTDYSLEAAEFVSVPDAVSRISESADLSGYDKVMPFIFPLEQGYPGCAAYLDKVSWDTPNGTFELGAAWLSGYECATKGRIAHEFGHTLGLVHSYSIPCAKEPPVPGSTIDPTDVNDSCFINWCADDDCTATSPGDSLVVANSDFDMLGGDHDERYENFFPVHYHATWQALAGWLVEYQVLVPENQGEFWLTTLESLSPTPKAMKILLGDDQMGDPQYYWLQTREFHSCKVDVRLQASNLGFADYPFDTYKMKKELGPPTGWTFDSHTPFWDPHRGIRVDVLECEPNEPGSPIRLKVDRTQLGVAPEIVAVFDTQETTITLSNDGGIPIDVGSASIGGRHPGAFTISSDGCSDRVLEPEMSCVITVHVSSDSQTDTHGLLKIPNSDTLAPELTVSLFRAGEMDP